MSQTGNAPRSPGDTTIIMLLRMKIFIRISHSKRNRYSKKINGIFAPIKWLKKSLKNVSQYWKRAITELYLKYLFKNRRLACCVYSLKLLRFCTESSPVQQSMYLFACEVFKHIFTLGIAETGDIYVEKKKRNSRLYFN